MNPEAGDQPTDTPTDRPPTDEAALLDAFDRLVPQGNLVWLLEEALRRLARPVHLRQTAPWPGLPDDLWDRGRAAKAGERMMGDVIATLADQLAADSRALVAPLHQDIEALNDRIDDALSALRFLAARVEAMELRHDAGSALDDELVQSAPLTDVTAWLSEVGSWFGPPDPDRPIVVAESGDGRLLMELQSHGHVVVGVEPRAEVMWRSVEPPAHSVEVALDVADDWLSRLQPAAAAGVLLAGCVDRLDLAGKLSVVRQAVRAVGTGGTVSLLVTEPAAWDDALPVVVRDLAPGRPLDPQTWLVLLRRMGVGELRWHRPTSGSVHGLVGRVGR